MVEERTAPLPAEGKAPPEPKENERIKMAVGEKTRVGKGKKEKMAKKGKEAKNEDSKIVILSEDDEGNVEGFLAIADGVGGQQKPDVASNETIRKMTREYQGAQEWDVVDKIEAKKIWLKEAIERIGKELEELKNRENEVIRQKNLEAGRRFYTENDMDSTLVAALVENEDIWIANLGDSPAYVVSEEDITQITEDHTFINKFLKTDRGRELSAEQIAKIPNKDKLVLSIMNRGEDGADVYYRRLGSREWLVLCCDGIKKLLGEEKIKEIVLSAESPRDACNRLVEAADEAGGNDDLTAIVYGPEKIKQE